MAFQMVLFLHELFHGHEFRYDISRHTMACVPGQASTGRLTRTYTTPIPACNLTATPLHFNPCAFTRFS